ncbi:hypothetical protein M3Y96_00138900 [Aphelenchoides besseyi]|nr:hypothetical protein M3Y96_00138900 [Aphelenchoides besseyi]
MNSGLFDAPTEINRQAEEVRDRCFRTGRPTAAVPPIALVPFSVQDTGNVNPNFIRSSLYRPPKRVQTFREVHFPFSLAVRPFAPLTENETPLPVIPLNNPPRCFKCKSFVGPSTVITQQKFECGICGTYNAIPTDYAIRLHNWKKQTYGFPSPTPESQFGAYEFEIESQTQKSVCFVFLLDISEVAKRAGVIELFVRNIPMLMNDFKRANLDVKVGMVAFDSALHYLDLYNPNHPRLCSIVELDEIFVPCLSGLLVSSEAFGCAFNKFGDQILNSLSTASTKPTIFGTAIEFVIQILKDQIGKVAIVQSTSEVSDCRGKLNKSQNQNLETRPIAWYDLMPANDYYEKLGIKCAQSGISFDLMILNSKYNDLKTVEPLITLTGGQITYYPNFNLLADGRRVVYDLYGLLHREFGFHSSLTMSYSANLKLLDIHSGGWTNPKNGNLTGNFDSNWTAQFNFDYTSDFGANEDAHFQVAVAYTTGSGKRRIRVLNLRLMTTNHYEEIYSGIDVSSLVSHFMKEARFRAMKNWSKVDVLDSMSRLLINSLSTYRRRQFSDHSLNDLIIPTQIRVLPFFVHGILRTSLFDESLNASLDERAFLNHLVLTMSPEDVLRYVCPRVISVKQTDSHFPLHRPSFNRIQSNGPWLIENGIDAILYLNDTVDVQWLREVFGCEHPKKIDDETVIPKSTNPTSQLFCCLWDELNAGRTRQLGFRVVHQKSVHFLRSLLTEDTYDLQMGFETFLRFVHGNIRSLLK